jgi:3-methyladenine DNA glycosylase AlkD
MYDNTPIQKELFLMRDEEYRNFNASLIPNISKDSVIGVRVPLLRSFAKKLAKTNEAESFLCELPHKYYEENTLHGFILESFKDYASLIKELDKFLPYVDNWATCDLMSPKILKFHTDTLLSEIDRWISSDDVYAVRFAIGLCMKYYLDEHFSPEILLKVSAVKSDEYYINMMISWFFATALAKRYDETLPYLTENRLEKRVHNKTIQKAVESHRISLEQKEYLKTLRIK